MLIFSNERLVPTDINMMVLAGKDSGTYFYIHRMLYDQAVILNDIYGDDINSLIVELTGENKTRGDVEEFYSKTPTPINIFAPYLLLVKEELTDFEDMVGAIHVMSGPVNLRQLLKYPIGVRNNPSFSLSIKEEYALAWDRFFQTTMPMQSGYVTVQPAQGYMPMNGTATTTVPVQEEEEEEEYTPITTEEEMAALEAELEAEMAAMFAENLAALTGPSEDEEEEEEEEIIASEPEPEPVVETKVKSGLQLLEEGLV